MSALLILFALPFTLAVLWAIWTLTLAAMWALGVARFDSWAQFWRECGVGHDG